MKADRGADGKTERSARTTTGILLPGIGVAGILITWQVAASLLNSTLLLPGPAETVRAFLADLRGLEFYGHLGATALRALIGFGLSLLTGIVWGLCAGLLPRVGSVLSPALVFIRSTPVIAVILLAIIWFAPDAAPVLVTWLMVMPIVEQTVEHGVRNTEFKLLEMARVFQVPPSRVLRDVHLPGLVPFVRASAHAGLGMAYKVTVAAEVLVQPPWGLGGAMQEARYYLDTPRIMALTISVIILSGLTEAALRIVDRASDRGRAAGSRRAAGAAGQQAAVKSLMAATRLPDSQAPDPVLRLCDVSKSFGAVPVLHRTSLEVRASRVTVLLGPSGCGKTTLLRCVARLEKADTGVIDSGGKAPAAIVFQEPRILPWRSLIDNIRFVTGPDEPDNASAWLAEVGLSDYLHDRPAVLSGGMVQRLSIARAFAVQSSLVLMDEPFQNLDVRTKLTLGQMTRRLHQERASATLYVTHDVMEAVLLADTIMILSERPAHVVFELDLDLSEEERDPRNTRVQRIAGELYDTLLSSNQQ